MTINITQESEHNFIPICLNLSAFSLYHIINIQGDTWVLMYGYGF